MKNNNNYIFLFILSISLIASGFSDYLHANAALLQNAYRQLQSFSIKDDDQASRVKALQALQELSLDQLKEEAELIETDIYNIKNDIKLAEEKKSVNYSRFKSEDLKGRMSAREMELSNWQLKKELSEEASIQLSRERLLLQEKNSKSRYAGESNSLAEQGMDEQKQHNVARKIRFAELFQSLASRRITIASDQIEQIEKQLAQRNSKRTVVSKSKTELPVSGEPVSSSPLDAESLKLRLSQTRKSLLQLQSLHYEMLYQMEQVQNVELLYGMMLRQKHRLKSIPDTLNVNLLIQELRVQRFQLFEEKTVLMTGGDCAEGCQKINETLSDLEKMLQMAAELQKLESELKEHQKNLLLLLDQKQLWMATVPALGPVGLLSMVTSLSQQIPLLLKTLFSDWLFWLALFSPFFCIFYRFGLKRWQHKLPVIDYEKNISRQSWCRITALILLRPSPLLLAAVLFGNLGLGGTEDFRGSWMIGLLVISYSWCVLMSALKHRGMNKILPILASNLHPFSSMLSMSSMIGLWLTALTHQWYENPFENRIGQLSLILVCIWQISLFWRWKNNFSRHDWRGLLVKIIATALLLVASVTAIFGYQQLSWLVFSHFQMLLIYGGYFWLLYLVADYQLRLRTETVIIRQLEKVDKAAVLNPEAKSIAMSEVSHATRQKLENQGRVLMTLFFSLAALTILLLIWQGLSPLLSPVSEAHLFSYAEGSGTLVIAFGTVVSVMLILLATWLVARNLTGMLQILLPAKMVKQAASAYIYNRIFSYLVWAVGITAAVGQMGIPWDRAQWFVLAIVVGVGLGLQDIVANFFSGLIILLERPIRVGDTVTIADRDGTVRKISIRATVIETFDRIELIVPNRLLISNQLTNWSLSSVVIRLSLWYGVSHDSDHKLVRRLLLQAAEESNMVRNTPASEAAFFEYTEHSQRYELRLYLGHADHRFLARNSVNCRVHELFKEHNVTIAHLQHDLHITNRNSDGLIKP